MTNRYISVGNCTVILVLRIMILQAVMGNDNFKHTNDDGRCNFIDGRCDD